jgi:SAM-dependent methyltransferase
MSRVDGAARALSRRARGDASLKKRDHKRAPARAEKKRVLTPRPRSTTMTAAARRRSQFFTPEWLARRMAGWVPRRARVLEPCCGPGNLIGALVDDGHPLHLIHAIEIDAKLMHRTRERFAGRIAAHDPAFRVGDFFHLTRGMFECFDVVLMNPVYENNLALEFVLRALELAPVVVAVVPSDFVYTQERDARLWATHGRITRRAELPCRVKFVGAGGQHEHVVLQIERRLAVRERGEVLHIPTEVWRPDDDVLVAPERSEACAA